MLNSNLSIENEYSLRNAFEKGLNLFVGAGFSIYAKDIENQYLPLGQDLAKELAHKFNKTQCDLVRISTLLERTVRSEFYSYLIKRFSVAEFDPIYNALNKINIKNIYTTNIDNLIPKIFSQNPYRYLHNQAQNGEATSSNAINYLPLHGNVDEVEPKFVFDAVSLANIYNDTTRIWSFLSMAIEKYPTVFLGYSFNDSSTIQALTSHHTFNNAQKEKWIVLPQANQDDIEYYKSLGFSIIIADTKSLLQYINSIQPTKENIISNKSEIEKLLAGNIVPSSIKGSISRPINEFFKGQAPTWSDIINNNVCKTSYYAIIQNSIFTPHKHTIITGAPATGKTTLMMQIAYGIKYEGTKLIFHNLTITGAEYYAKLIGDHKVLIFIENFTDDINAFFKLANLKNAKLVGVDRSHNLNMVNHKFPSNQYNIINVTELSDSDIQNIFDSLPPSIKGATIKKEKKNRIYEDDSIFEFVARNIKGQNVTIRYQEVLQELELSNHELAEFLVLCAYMHSSRVPLSLEVACSYFNETNQIYQYQKVIDMREKLNDLLKDYYTNELIDNETDFYYPRSSFIAESIIKNASRELLRDVMTNVIKRVPSIQIYNYHVFKKHAFDKSIVSKAFPQWKDGKAFYEQVFLYDYHNPYVLQQGALYLSSKKKFQEAFAWIDKAINITNNKQFSIRNSHAIILFDANYDIDSLEAERQLDQSMDILSQCVNSDLRKTFHAITYADQAIKYYHKYGTEKAISYLKQAQTWLNSEREEHKWDRDVRKRISLIEDILTKISQPRYS